MKRIVTFSLCLCIFAAPCLYDVTSTELSPLAATFAAMGVGSLRTFELPTQ